MRGKRTKGLPLKIYLPYSAHPPFPNVQSEEMKEDVLFPRHSVCILESRIQSRKKFPPNLVSQKQKYTPAIYWKSTKAKPGGWMEEGSRETNAEVSCFPIFYRNSRLYSPPLEEFRSPTFPPEEPSRNLQQGSSFVISYDPPFPLHHSSDENKRRKEEG